MLTLLLGNGASRAVEIKESYEPLFKSKEEFLAYQDAICCSGDRITYTLDDDGNPGATVRL